ncbi:hypothetical protein DES40_1084 [Litorimonas taeanensis]|uniref:Uncharacterized protein n=1 Tax=Litorimonas taeanensis TaxID=568099 RepID=A0A420WL63_9PROT|nr:hypothetical protein [Litorimonas taeanensis]RKQ71754.1 hypothetical protein DES40_1084 [Litorimonas taeanensis]
MGFKSHSLFAICCVQALLLGACNQSSAAKPNVEPETPALQNTGPLTVPDYTPPQVSRYKAKTLRSYTAPEADQGAAIDEAHLYAVDNTVIAKYRRSDGAFLGRFIGPKNGLIRHMNSCYAKNEKLWCANSNYSQVPMASSIEIFDTQTLQHIESHSLGLRDEGSLTWFDEVDGGYIAGFAHYDNKGSAGFKDSRYASVVAFDAAWRRTGGWLFPGSAIERMKPYAASGGALGPDGLLYILGHDRPEMYVLAKPVMGPTLIHIATIDLEVEGQAFSWGVNGSRNIVAVERRDGLIREIEIPAITFDEPTARRFR